MKKIGKYSSDHESGGDILVVTPKSWSMKEKLISWTLFKLKLLFKKIYYIQKTEEITIRKKKISKG